LVNMAEGMARPALARRRRATAFTPRQRHSW
jgi:hypothetical protein